MSEQTAHLQSPLLAACRELARAMDDFDEAACRALSLGRSDLRALNQLEHGPLNPSELARRLGLTRPAVTALIDRLARARFVARDVVPDDRRATTVRLEPATWQRLARVYRPLGERVARLGAELPDARLQALVGGLEGIAGVFDEVRAGVEPPPQEHSRPPLTP